MRGVTLALALSLPAPAFAATTFLFGESAENQACYEAAEAHDVTRGLAHCDAAINDADPMSPNLAANYVNRGILMSAARRYRAALEDFGRALQLNPGQPEAYANRGNVNLLRGHAKAAVADYSRAIAGHCPKLSIVYYGRARAYEALGHIPEAIADLKAALALNPNFTEARKGLEAYHGLS
jgi:tetratricopeptide (TPR) repeat protein